LNRLAARALGVLPVAEPLVPTRFDPGVRHVDLTPFESINQSSGVISESDDRAAQRQAPVSPLESGFVRSGSPFGDLEDATHLIRSQHGRVSRLRNLQQPLANEPRPSGPDAQSTRLARTAPPVPPWMREAEDAASRSSDTNVRSALPLFAEPRPGPINTVPESSRAPIQHPQSEASSVRGMPPVVRVSIGRIEVRAELPERAPAPAPQRSRSSHVSLEQFLKQAGGGAR
jgi:hypothetical protein